MKEKLIEAKRVRRKMIAILVSLSVVVSCSVFWQLRMDGVAMANETFCGMEEHTHGEECYEETLICGLEEDAGHEHDVSCYEEVLVCDIPEHTHTVSCLIDETADVETAEDWEATLPNDLTGIWAYDVVAIAESQIGYTESEANFQLAEDGETRQGYTRFGAWYGNEYGDWDAMFASFCLYYAGVPEEEFPEASGAYAWTTDLKEMEEADVTGETVLLVDAEGYIPEPGDLVFFDTDGDGITDRVGIVETVETEGEDIDGPTGDMAGADSMESNADVNLEKLTVIEGDSNDMVESVVYDYTSKEPEDIEAVATIATYGVLPEQPDVESEIEDAPDVMDVDEYADVEEYAWNDDAKGKVVLNLGNGNGKYNNADYTHDRQEGTLLRYTTDSLADYADSDGKVTVNLPSDSNLNSTFTVVDASGSLSAVTVNLGSDLAYDYKLVGWVNIATGEYYDVIDGATTVTVDLDNDNVFYADWIAATYDHGSGTDANLRDDTVSTSGFVTIHMYDYNELFNMYSESLVQNEEEDGTLWEAWTDSGSLYYDLSHTGTPATESFIFVNNGTVGYSSTQGVQSTGGMLSWPNYKADGNTWTGTGKNPRNATDIWGITSPYSAPMNMLFDSSEKYLGVHYVGEADYLFWKDENGYYTYNSKEAAATYNQSDQRFYVYDGVQNVTNTNFSCFLPYNTYGESLNAVNGTVNYFFGMDMEVNFYLPNATGATGGNKVNGEDMVFNFSGDDDILIFIDNELVLDMSGIHDESFGSINFSDGTVTMGMSTDSDGNIIDGTTTDISLSSGTHDLKVYYMERGGYASNLEIQFNVVSLWDYVTGDVQTVTAEKTWVDSQGNVIEDPTAISNVYSSVEVGLFDVLGPETEDAFGYMQSGDIYTVEFTDDSGVTRTYVYDNSGETPTLTYTEVSSEGTVSGTDDQVDSEGRVVDDNGYVVAWLEDGNLHIRMDKQTLNNDNGWYYAWELLDPEGNYEVLELSESSSYTTSSTREDLTTYNYWSIIGDSEIENSFETGETLQVILTEAAQEASNTLGNTKDAMGWVIVATESGVTAKQVEFSQIADLQEIKDESSGQTTYKTIAGVTSQSEIDALGPGAIWYVVDAESQNTDATGTELEDFYLYCILDGSNYYLSLQEGAGNYTLGVTSGIGSAGVFCYDSLGEQLAVLSDGSTVRVEIEADGTIQIGDTELEAARDDIRIFTLQETQTSGFSFTATNTFLPDITLEKVDAATGEPIEGVEFTLQNAEGKYYKSYDGDTDKVTWSDEQETVTTDDNGTYLFHSLADDEYTLTEISALEGYNPLPAAINITIETTEDGINITYDWVSEVDVDISEYITLEDNSFTITVANRPGMELPQTGGVGTRVFTVSGLLLIGCAGGLLYRRRRRKTGGIY